jgi:hypothetical protein
MGVANDVHIYALFSTEGGVGRNAYVLVRGEECDFVSGEVVDEVCRVRKCTLHVGSRVCDASVEEQVLWSMVVYSCSL